MDTKINYNDLVKTYENINSENENHFEFLGRKIIESVQKYGMGTLPKSDIEAMIFHCICNAIESEFSDDIQGLDYALMQMLRISPSKLRSLRVTRSAKFLRNLDYKDRDNKLRLIRALKNASIGGNDILRSKITISISDPHTQQLIERMIEDNKGIIEHSTSPKLLVISAKEFLGIIVQIYGDGSADGYEKTIQAIKDEAHELHKELTQDNILQEFQNAFKEKAFEKMVTLSLKAVGKFVNNKLFGTN